MRKSDAVQPTAQSLIANFAPEALFKGGKQVVNRVKRGFLNKLPKSLNIFNMMAMPFLILGFGTGSAFFFIDAQLFIKAAPLYTEYSANFDLLHALLQMRGYGSFSHGLGVWHGQAPGKWMIV